MDDRKLIQLLEKACPRPSYLSSTDGGAILALALHCFMVDEGFLLVTEDGQSIANSNARYAPPKDWNGKLLDQWVFTYTKPGKARKFTIHCSLQARTKRMLIHASEENNMTNICVLGLQLENYVSDQDKLKSNSWEVPSKQGSVVHNAAKMSELMTKHILTPLLQAAEEEQGPPSGLIATAGEGKQHHRTSAWLTRSQPLGEIHYLTVAAAAGLALGVVGLLLLHSRSSVLQRKA